MVKAVKCIKDKYKGWLHPTVIGQT